MTRDYKLQIDTLKALAQKNAKLNNSEQACAALMQVLARGRSGYLVNKRNVGKCWTETCCYNKIKNCELEYTKEQKADILYKGTYIHKLLSESGVLNVTHLY